MIISQKIYLESLTKLLRYSQEDWFHSENSRRGLRLYEVCTFPMLNAG